MLMAGQLEVTPPELTFVVKRGETARCQIKLTNLGTQPQAYKIKTTNPKEYMVRPNLGIVMPNEYSCINVLMAKCSTLPPARARFLIQSCVLPPLFNQLFDKHDVSPVFDKFRTAEVIEKMGNAEISECRLPCVFHHAENISAAGPAAARQAGLDKAKDAADVTERQRLTKQRAYVETCNASDSSGPKVYPMSPTYKDPADKKLLRTVAAPLLDLQNKKKPAAKLKPTYTYSYVVCALLATFYFILGRFTADLRIPGIPGL